jgi:hypothetical protein
MILAVTCSNPGADPRSAESLFIFAHTVVTRWIFDHALWNLQQGCQMVCFHTKKIPIWVYFEGLGMENDGIVYRHLDYFTAIW